MLNSSTQHHNEATLPVIQNQAIMSCDFEENLGVALASYFILMCVKQQYKNSAPVSLAMKHATTIMKIKAHNSPMKQKYVFQVLSGFSVKRILFTFGQSVVLAEKAKKA